MTKKLKTIIIALAASGIYMQVNAQDYIYKINNGSSAIYTDRVPANEKREFTILSSKSGTVKKVIEKELTDFEAEERKKQKEEEIFASNRAAEERRKDDVLLQTYSSVEDIDKYRDYELNQINLSIESSIDNIAIYKDRIEGLQEILSKNSANKTVKADLDKVRINLAETQRNLDSSKKLYIEKQAKYQEDKLRYERVMQDISLEAKAKAERNKAEEK
jgi:hypothetical protein